MDDWTEKTSRMLAKQTSRRGFLGWLGKASVALVGGAALAKTGQSVHAQEGDQSRYYCSGCRDVTCYVCQSGKLWRGSKSEDECCSSPGNCWTVSCGSCNPHTNLNIPCP